MDDTRDEVDEILAGMTGGRTGTAGGVSSPVPPAADWARGLDAASASAARLTVLLSDVYRAHQGKDPSASLAAQIEQTVRNLTGEPPQEPEYGPGLWTAMPQRSWETMGMARPIDWTGAPSRTEIDLMTMHAIRYGEWLCRTFPTWEQTLPACWIEHDDVVAEVFALKCHADLAAASPNGGMYMPALMQDIHQALARVKEYLTAAGTGESSHAHHMDGEQHASRRRAREVEYESWYRRRGGWKTEPAFTGRWRGPTGRNATACHASSPRTPAVICGNCPTGGVTGGPWSSRPATGSTRPSPPSNDGSTTGRHPCPMRRPRRRAHWRHGDAPCSTRPGTRVGTPTRTGPGTRTRS